MQMSEQVTAVSEVGSAGGTGSARIMGVAEGRKGTRVSATGTFGAGIGRVDFVLVDLASEQPATVMDRLDVDYAPPLLKEVSETWTTSASLAPGRTYRAFFHVYDRSGTNLVAYDRRDFTCILSGPGEPEVER